MIAASVAAIAEEQSAIVGFSVDSENSSTTRLHMVVQVRDKTHLSHVLRHLARIPGVQQVWRRTTEQDDVPKASPDEPRMKKLNSKDLYAESRTGSGA